ncbi:MAG: polysulfide reductase NrfD [Coriobacteriales bacterium]|jgi:formate-dependent nitrite reductase membrane component NrfD|nr:polysulfide reductase NrfD [Coriobacteriales bacterium]
MMIWGSIIAWYLFLAGLAAGAFATAALVSFKDRGRKAFVKVQLVGRIVALLALAIGLFLLIFDAEAGFKNPLRFFYLLTNFASVMTWGVVILGVFGCVSLVTLLLSLLKKHVPYWLDGLGIAAAACTAAYTGVLIGVIKTYPLWNTALLPVLFLVSALSAGMAATFILSALIAPRELEGLGILKKLHFALLPTELLLLVALLYVASSTAPAAQASVERLVSGDLALTFWLGLVVAGLIVPLFSGGIGIGAGGNPGGRGSDTDGADGARASGRGGAGGGGRGRTSSGIRTMEAAGDVGVLVGGFLLRYLIIVAAVPLTFVF